MSLDMRHRWDGLYPPGAGADAQQDQTTYQLAASWLNWPGWVIEDWGGGKGWLWRYLTQVGTYRVIDGSVPPYIDLQTYQSDVDAIVLRHVLEHNHNWAQILANACRSCHHLVVILFTPLSHATHQIATNWADIPDLSFAKDDLLRVTTTGLHRLVHEVTVASRTQYQQETVLYFEGGHAWPSQLPISPTP